MANQVIAKDIGIENEATYGASRAGTASRLHITNVTLNLNPNKSLVEDTPNNVKGFDRMVRITNQIEGDISGFATPRIMHHMLELANGAAGTTSALGSSAVSIQYNQNVTGSMLSKTINSDRHTSTEKYSGVVGTGLELKSSNNKTEFTLNALAKTRGAGTSMGYIGGETIKPFIFADWTIKVSNGASFAAAGTSTVPVSEWSMKYENGVEGSYLSGSRDIQRVDPKIPKLSGKFKIFHEYSDFVDGAFGTTEYSLRFEGILPTGNGLIAGATPYMLRIDLPRVEFKSNVRNYEAAQLAVEEIEFEAMFEAGLSALWVPTMTLPFDHV